MMKRKLLLAAIAAGLWANAITMMVRPAHATAIDTYGVVESLHHILVALENIESNTARIPWQ